MSEERMYGPGRSEEQRLGFGLRSAVALGLDLVIAGYAAVLVTILTTGGVDLGLLSLTDPSKPILILILIVPLRAALDDRSWLLDRLQAKSGRWQALLRGRPIPPAISDVGFALAATVPATLTIAFLADLLWTPHRGRTFTMPFESERFAQVFAGWDSGWYFDIARRGYYFNPDGQSSIAFFPLYPMMMRTLAWPFGSSDRALWIAGIFVSFAAFAVALYVLHRFTERTFGDRGVARRAVLYLALFPFAFFFSRVYAESVFLAMSLLALNAAYSDRWVKAGMWGALATLARPNGILIGLPLFLLALRVFPDAGGLARRLLPLLLVPLALGGYCIYVYSLSGNPLAWLSAQANWGYSLGHSPWEQLLKMLGRLVKYGPYDYFFVSGMAPFRLFHGCVGLVFLALTPAVFRRLGAPLGAYVLVSLLIPLSGNALEGIGRYASVLFPVFMLLGTFKSPRVQEGILITSGLFLALLAGLFSTGRPVY